MGLFKWYVKLGEYGEYIADGYAYARNRDVLLEELKMKYNNTYHNVVVEDDYEFDEDDIEVMTHLQFIEIITTKIAVRWEE